MKIHESFAVGRLTGRANWAWTRGGSGSVLDERSYTTMRGHLLETMAVHMSNSSV